MKMENDTEYCSFVSTHCIICECGDTFPTEESLKEHLETGHGNSGNIFSLTETKIVQKVSEKVATPKKVVKEKLVTIDNKSTKPKVKLSVLTLKQLENGTQVILPDGRVQIRIPDNILYKIPSSDDAEDQPIQEEPVYETEIKTEVKTEIKTEPEVFEEPPEPPEPPACREVAFTEELLKQEHVILEQENEEHDYVKEADPLTVETFFFCEVCGKTFSSVRSVSLHVARVHEKKTQSPGQRSPRKDPKKAVCDVCGKNYASNAALRYHQRVHTGEKPYHCTECPKSFTMPLFLQIHMRTHTGERPYECPHCPKAFSSKAALLRHDRVHTGVKPYECPKCFKTFSQSNSMKLHVQTVHLKMPAPYKSAARRLKALRRQQMLEAHSHAAGDSMYKGKKMKLAPGVERMGLDSKIKLLDEDQEYVVEEIAYDDDDDSNCVYEEVFIPMKPLNK